MVEIYLITDEAEVPVRFLSVTMSDVRRLAIRPFKCGDQCATLDGPLVDYDTDIASFADATYYDPYGKRFLRLRLQLFIIPISR
jgi:hypothetical protein